MGAVTPQLPKMDLGPPTYTVVLRQVPPGPLAECLIVEESGYAINPKVQF